MFRPETIECPTTDSATREKQSANRAPPPRVQVVRHALDSAVLPLATATLPIAEEIRREAIIKFVDPQGRRLYGSDWSWEAYKAKKLSVPLSPMLLGKGAEGNRRMDEI